MTENGFSSATIAFWHPHTMFGNQVVVACGSHLFFHDPETASAFRFYDFNFDSPAEETLRRLKLEHSTAYKPVLMPWYHSYLSNGEINAYETILRWFHSDCGLVPRRYQSRDIALAQIYASSPILFGRPERNGHIKTLMDSAPAQGLGSRIHARLGAVTIAQITNGERKALSKFPLSGDGMLGPIASSEMVFGLVSRFPNPSGHGPVTIISADSHAKAVSKIAELLTNEGHAEAILRQTGWSREKGLPETFEMLFAIEISSPDLQGEGKADLLISRPYSAAAGAPRKSLLLDYHRR